MPAKPTFKQRFQYFFDNFMSRGTIALIGGLGLISLLLILLAGLAISIGGRMLAPEGSEGMGFIEAAWESLMRTLDAGTMGGDSGWGFRLIMLGVTLGGIFIVSEMLDLRNRQLAEVTRVDDFIVSDHLISLMMAQLADNGDLYAVFGQAGKLVDMLESLSDKQGCWTAFPGRHWVGWKAR